jgi:hypothetical protein
VNKKDVKHIEITIRILDLSFDIGSDRFSQLFILNKISLPKREEVRRKKKKKVIRNECIQDCAFVF